MGFPGGSDSEESAMWETWIQSLGWKDLLEKRLSLPWFELRFPKVAVRHSIKRNRHEESCRDKDERFMWTYFGVRLFLAPFPVGMVESERSTDKTKYSSFKIMKTKAENKWAAYFNYFIYLHSPTKRGRICPCFITTISKEEKKKSYNPGHLQQWKSDFPHLIKNIGQ